MTSHIWIHSHDTNSSWKPDFQKEDSPVGFSPASSVRVLRFPDMPSKSKLELETKSCSSVLQCWMFWYILFLTAFQAKPLSVRCAPKLTHICHQVCCGCCTNVSKTFSHEIPKLDHFAARSKMCQGTARCTSTISLALYYILPKMLQK